MLLAIMHALKIEERIVRADYGELTSILVQKDFDRSIDKVRILEATNLGVPLASGGHFLLRMDTDEEVESSFTAQMGSSDT